MYARDYIVVIGGQCKPRRLGDQRGSKCHTRFNKIAMQATAQMAAYKEAVGLSRVHMYESKFLLPYEDTLSEGNFRGMDT